MNACPFSVFKRTAPPCYLAVFKDANGKYLPPLSTKKTTEKEAVKAAFDRFRDGFPKKNALLMVQDLSLKDIVKKLKS